MQRYGKMFHGQTLKSATSDYDERHVIAFRPISVAARSWSYDNMMCGSKAMFPFHNIALLPKQCYETETEMELKWKI